MLCGRIRSALRTKWNQFHFWIWRNKYGYFYCNGFCVGCKFFNRCFDEFMDVNVWHPEEYEMGEGYYQHNK